MITCYKNIQIEEYAGPYGETHRILNRSGGSIGFNSLEGAEEYIDMLELGDPASLSMFYSCDEVPCTPKWECEIPLNGYASDGCGNRIISTSCNPGGPCTPIWNCELPLNGYEKDGCGNRRPSIFCNPTCIPHWICEIPLNGYAFDGCGNRRIEPACYPCSTPWVCELPLNGYEKDECGNRRLNARCNPPPACTPTWVCESPLNGYESDGCGNRRLNAACDTLPGTGSVQFVTVPTGADIYLNGSLQDARTPATITNLSSGDHTYKLVLSGYKDATGTVRIEAGTTTTLSVSLTKPEAAVGTGTILGISLLGLGILGAVVYATREKKPEYTVPGYKGG